ncbi:hypothetical protein HYPSUDRAFT_213659, partial [Hypholoma sublateritium FD-334 SS-4]
MELQTPHPTLQSQSQIFKLPSSSPKPSPRSLSPVPLAPTSSKHSKENAHATSTPWNRHASKSFALGITPIPPFSRKSRARSGRRPAHSHSRSSSNSHSHSNASSRANSKEPSMRKPKMQSHAQLIDNAISGTRTRKTQKTVKATIPPRPLESPFASRAPSPAENMPVDSHISTHPVKNRIVHQYTSARRLSDMPRAVLTNASVDHNLPVELADAARKQGSQSVQTSPQKVAYKHTFTRPKPVKRNGKDALEKRIYVPSHLIDHSLKRCPSAPSGLALPKQIRQSSVLGPGRVAPPAGEASSASLRPFEAAKANGIDAADATKAMHKSGLNAFLGRLLRAESRPSSTGEAGPPTPLALETNGSCAAQRPPAPGPLVRPSASMQDLHAHHPRSTEFGNMEAGPHSNEPYSRNGVAGDDDARTTWMGVRGGVDFNRPPSQMSLFHAGGRDIVGEFGTEQEWHDTIFTSSSSEESSYGNYINQEAPIENRLERRPSLARSMKSKSRKQATKIGTPECRRLTYGDEPVWLVAPDSTTVPGMGGLGIPFGFGFGFGLDDALELKFDADVMHIDEALFGGDAYKASTPSVRRMRKARPNGQGHAHMRRPVSLPALRSAVLEDGEEEEEIIERANVVRKSVSDGQLKQTDDISTGEADWEDEESGEQDMELTGSIGAKLERETDGDSLISWVTDSVISAPTGYLEQKRRRAEHESPRSEEEAPDSDKTQCSRASSTSDSKSLFEPTLGAPFKNNGQEPSPRNGQPFDYDDDNDAAAANRSYLVPGMGTSATAKRTRSGTIVPANVLPTCMPPGARRTRSGTIVGPLPPAPPPAFGLPAIPGAG